MKKALILIALLIMPIFVYASEDYFYYVNKVSTETTSTSDINFTKSLKTEDGYLYFKSKTLRYVDNNGDLKWELQISKDKNTSVDILLDGENVIYTKTGKNGKTCKIKLANKEEVACVDFPGFKLADMGDNYVALNEGYLVSINKSAFTINSKTVELTVPAINMLADNNYVYVYTSDGYINKYDKDLNSKEQIKTDFAKAYSGEEDYNLSDKSVKGMFLGKDTFVISNFSVYEIDKNGKTVVKIKGTDLEGELNSGVNKEYHSGTYINKYIVLGGARVTCPSVIKEEKKIVIDDPCSGYTPFIEIYDQSFNLLDTIDVAPENEDWLMVKDVTATKDDEGILVKWIQYGSLNVAEYKIKFNIETKTDGNGTVKASKVKSPSGEVIEFTVTPNEGYVLGEVRVTDANGKTVVFKEGKFTMPSADVLIEAVFLPKNPETVDGIFMILTILIISGCAVIFTAKRKRQLQ